MTEQRMTPEDHARGGDEIPTDAEIAELKRIHAALKRAIVDFDKVAWRRAMHARECLWREIHARMEAARR